MKTVFFNLSMTEELREALKIQATKEKKSMNELINEMISASIRAKIEVVEKKLRGEI